MGDIYESDRQCRSMEVVYPACVVCPAPFVCSRLSAQRIPDATQSRPKLDQSLRYGNYPPRWEERTTFKFKDAIQNTAADLYQGIANGTALAVRIAAYDDDVISFQHDRIVPAI